MAVSNIVLAAEQVARDTMLQADNTLKDLAFSHGLQTNNNSDLEYFIYHRDNDNQAIHIGSIVSSRTTGGSVIPISRRIVVDGTFVGHRAGWLLPEFFQSCRYPA